MEPNDTAAVADKPAPASTFMEGVLGVANGGSAADVKTPRVFHEKFPIADIVVRADENYRWGNDEAMEADLGALDLTYDNGEERSSFALLCESVRALGVEDPVGVVRRDDGYHVIFGFTRVVAAKRVQRDTVPAFVYDQSISDDEIQIMQMRENSMALKRAVNWINELDMFRELVARLINAGHKTQVARKTVGSIMGRNEHTFASRAHYVTHLDKRVVELARNGHLSCHAAIEFYSGNIDSLYHRDFITETLAKLKASGGGVYPPSIGPEQVRQAMRFVRTRGGESYADEDRLLKTPKKHRQSPGVLRDVAVLIIQRMLDRKGLSVSSPAAEVEALIGSSEWAQIGGLGMGAGDVSMPPVLEHELTKAINNDKSAAFITDKEELRDREAVRTMEMQHQESSRRYVTSIVVQAFLRVQLELAGVRNFDRDEQGWVCRSTTFGDDKDAKITHHRIAFSTAVSRAVAMPASSNLHARVLAAWQHIRPLAPKPQAGPSRRRGA